MNFSSHNQTVPLAGIIPPARTVTEILHVNKILLSKDRSAINAFVDEKIREERERELQQLAKELNPDSK
jgi:hypothetical protein